MKIQIGKSAPTKKPTPSLAEQLQMQKDGEKALAEKKPNSGLLLNSQNKKPTTTQPASQPVKIADSLSTALVNSQSNSPDILQATVAQQTAIPELAAPSEKYILTAEASESLPTEILEGFAEKMQSLITYMDSPELHTSLADILKYTQTNPNLRGILRETDVQLFVRAARKSYGMVVTAKTANKTKKKKSDALVADLQNELGDLELSL